MDVGKRPVREVMQAEVAVLGPDERLDLADDIMKLGRVRHVPVVEEGRLVGMLSSRDVLAASLTRALDFEESQRRTFLHGVRVDEIMSRDLVTIGPDATLREAAQRMVRHKVGSLPVVEGDRVLVGIVTETDVLESVIREERGAVEEEGREMSAADRLQREIEELKRIRDELRVRIHLGKEDARDLWERTERKLHEAEGRVKALAGAAEEPLHDVAEAARLLVDEVREAFRKIREAL